MIEVVAAAIVLEGKLLCFKRGPSKFPYVSHKFEFPGGKVEQGEDLVSALKRELLEELNLDAEIGALIDTIEHTYPDFQIRMNCFLATVEIYDGTLHEHVEYKHIHLDRANEINWIEADIPIVENLRKNYSHVFNR